MFRRFVRRVIRGEREDEGDEDNGENEAINQTQQAYPAIVQREIAQPEIGQVNYASPPVYQDVVDAMDAHYADALDEESESQELEEDTNSDNQNNSEGSILSGSNLSDFVDLGYLTDEDLDQYIDDELRRWAPDNNDDIYVDVDQIGLSDAMRGMGYDIDHQQMFPNNIAIYNVGTRRVRSIEISGRRYLSISDIDNYISRRVEEEYANYILARKRAMILRNLENLTDLEAGDSDDSDDACIVCMERLIRVEFNCGHAQTCATCSLDVIRSNHLCPMCRADINLVKVLKFDTGVVS